MASRGMLVCDDVHDQKPITQPKVWEHSCIEGVQQNWLTQELLVRDMMHLC